MFGDRVIGLFYDIRYREAGAFLQIQAAASNRRDAFNVYMTLLLSTAQDVPQETLAAELVTWSAEQTAPQVQDMRRFGGLFVQQVERFRRDRNADTVPIMNEILQR